MRKLTLINKILWQKLKNIPLEEYIFLKKTKKDALIYLGSKLFPIKNSSTALAHCLPSRIAQTTND